MRGDPLQQISQVLLEKIEEARNMLKPYSTREYREKLMRRSRLLIVLAAVLPIVVTFIAAWLYHVSQNLYSLFVSIVDVIPPLFISDLRDSMEFYNHCMELDGALVRLKWNIRELEALGALDEETAKKFGKRIDDIIKHIYDLFGRKPEIPSTIPLTLETVKQGVGR